MVFKIKSVILNLFIMLNFWYDKLFFRLGNFFLNLIRLYFTFFGVFFFFFKKITNVQSLIIVFFIYKAYSLFLNCDLIIINKNCGNQFIFTYYLIVFLNHFIFISIFKQYHTNNFCIIIKCVYTL